ncbi:MAG: hypothetical protein M1298_00470 [Chloroflexi bacterium]|nr:hypothetical protein [Chloroflexota bacterium]
MEIIRPRGSTQLPAFVAGTLYAYEDVIGVFPGIATTRPALSGLPLNTVALTSSRILAFDIYDATRQPVSLRFSEITAISTREDATAGRLSCYSHRCDIHTGELSPDDALFLQDLIYHAVSGTLFRLNSGEERSISTP